MSLYCMNDKLGNISLDSLLKLRQPARHAPKQSVIQSLTAEIEALQKENAKLKQELAEQKEQIKAAFSHSSQEDYYGLDQSVKELSELILDSKDPFTRESSFVSTDIETRKLQEELQIAKDKHSALEEQYKALIGSPYETAAAPFYKEIDSWLTTILKFIKTKSQDDDRDFFEIPLPLSKDQKDLLNQILQEIYSSSLSEEKEKKYQETIQRLSEQLMERKEPDTPRTERDPLFFSDSEFSDFHNSPNRII